MRKITLKDYIRLSKSIKNVDDIDINKSSLLNVYEIVDCEFDKIKGRAVSICFNNVKLDWFETDDKIISYIVLMGDSENYKNKIKNRILECLSDKLFMMYKLGGLKIWDKQDFKESNSYFESLNTKQK